MSASISLERPGNAAVPPDDAVRTPRPPGRVDVRLLIPTLVTLLNGVAFLIVRPDVNDVWAARARAAAVDDGVGLTYWFGWFGGGTTPGTYSVVTPQLSALLGVELLCALAAVAVTAVGTLALRGTPHRLAGTWALTFVTVANLWSGRVPFLLGAAFAVGAIVAVRHRNRPWTVVLTLLSMCASPVTGAFLAMGLSGTFITTRTRAWRPIIGWAASTVAVAAVIVTVVFGAPGPEGFAALFALQVLGCLVLLWFARPPDHIRTTIMWSVVAVAVLFAIPNGMGSNFARFVVFVLPVVVLATTGRSLRTAVLLITPVLVAGAAGTVNDLYNSGRPVSSVMYYEPLARQLDQLPDLRTYRVEVVNHGAHAGYDALLDHAMLARGWETQQDLALNPSLSQDPLDAVTYKVWLDNNAVGYVALPATSVESYPEYDLVKSGRADYLQEIWRSTHWKLFRVRHPSPIIAPPAQILASTQSSLTVSLPCTCTTPIRIHYSKFLEATWDDGLPPDTDRPQVTATVADDGSGWTTLTTRRPGTYVLTGSLKGIAR